MSRGERALVVGRRVERRVAGRDARLAQVERDDGAAIAMYSTILFIVETSLSGFFGSGARQTSAVER